MPKAGRRLLTLLSLLLLGAPLQSQEAAAPCCFNNPRYAGVCQVRPAGEETCASILGYLNDAAAVGKDYCGGTNGRGGWQQLACQPAAGTAGAQSCTPRSPLASGDQDTAPAPAR